MMLTRNRDKRPAAGVPQTDEVPETGTAPDDFTAQAEALRQEAEDARSRAAEARAEAQERVSAAQAEATRIVREAEAEARTIAAGASSAEHAAERLDERARSYDAAASLEAQAAEAIAVVHSLRDEREQLAAQIAGLDDRIAGFGSERQATEAQRATALGRLDKAAAEDLRREIDATAAVLTEADRQRQALQARMTEIGDGTGPGELHDTLTAASACRAELRSLLNRLDPERPEARADEFMAVVEANKARIAAEAAQSASRPRPLTGRQGG